MNVEAKITESAMNLVEGCVFINQIISSDQCINGQKVHLCSNTKNPGYNQGHRFTVELKNSDSNRPDDDNINVWIYDTLFSSIDFSLYGTNTGIELSDWIDSAKIIVSHTNGLNILIECIEIKHRLSEHDLRDFSHLNPFDLRSIESRKYCIHNDENIFIEPNDEQLQESGNLVVYACNLMSWWPRNSNGERLEYQS